VVNEPSASFAERNLNAKLVDFMLSVSANIGFSCLSICLFYRRLQKILTWASRPFPTFGCTNTYQIKYGFTFSSCSIFGTTCSM